MFYKGEVPFVRFLIPLVLGISVGYYFAHPLAFEWALIAGTLILAIFGFFLLKYKRYSLYRSAWLFGLIINLYIMLVGYYLTVNVSEKFNDKHFSFQQSEALVVQVQTEPKISKGILRFEAVVLKYYNKQTSGIVSGKLLLALQVDSKKSPFLNYGDIVLIPAFYDDVEPPYNPGEFDYKAYLANRQIYHQAFLSQSHVRILKRDSGNRIISFSLNLRKRLVQKFLTYLPDTEASAFGSTLILGYRADLSKELINAYSKTGTMHVLSVSGMHVGIVFLVLTFLLQFMDKSEKLRLIRAFFIAFVIWFYALLTGFSAPVCRAAVMLSFVIIGKALNKNQNTYNLIAISAFFLLLYNPFYLGDAGFQLSYLAVAGLVYFHPKIYHAIFIRNKMLDHTWSYCALSIAAQLATFPLSLYYFHQFPVYFLISNLLIVLPVAIIMYSGIVFLLLPYSIIIQPLGSFLNYLISYTNNILYTIESLPVSSWSGIWINSFQCLMIYMIIACFILRFSFNMRKLSLPLSIVLLVLTISFALKAWVNYKRHELVFFSLRKNSAIAYLYHGKSIIVSDMDLSDKLFSFSITPVLERRGNQEWELFDTNRSFSLKSCKGDPDYFQFADFRILRWSRNFDKLIFTSYLKVDAVLIGGNPTCTLAGIRRSVDFNRVIIEGTNPDYKIKAWTAEAKELNIPFYVLKKNPAYIVKL